MCVCLSPCTRRLLTRSLKTALAYTLERDQSKDAQFLTPDSPADSAIKLFNSLLLGHEVSRL